MIMITSARPWMILDLPGIQMVVRLMHILASDKISSAWLERIESKAYLFCT